jgi:hypothetical protein
LLVYDCKGGELRLSLRSPVAQTVDVLRDDETVRSLRLRPGQPLETVVPAPPPAGTGRCRFKLIVEESLEVERLDFVRAA